MKETAWFSAAEQENEMGQLLSHGPRPLSLADVLPARTGRCGAGAYRELLKLWMALAGSSRRHEIKPENVKWLRRQDPGVRACACSENEKYGFVPFSICPWHLRAGAEKGRCQFQKSRPWRQDNLKQQEGLSSSKSICEGDWS